MKKDFKTWMKLHEIKLSSCNCGDGERGHSPDCEHVLSSNAAWEQYNEEITESAKERDLRETQINVRNRMIIAINNILSLKRNDEIRKVLIKTVDELFIKSTHKRRIL